MNDDSQNINATSEAPIKDDSKHRNLKYIGLTIAFIALVGIGVFFVFFFHLQRWENETYELGTPIETNLCYYVKGTEISANRGSLDISSVDNMKVGVYYATVSYRFTTYTYEITIEDTVAPEINVNKDLSNINIGIVYEPDRFLDGTFDLAGPVDVWFLKDGENCSDFLFDERREYAISIYAEDINENIAEKTFTITAVDTIAPSITGFDYDYPYYAVDEEYGIDDFVTSISDNSGAYEAEISVTGYTEGYVNFDDAGEYEVLVTAVDEAGNHSEFSVLINADYRPVIYGASDKTIRVNSEYNVLEGILAWDNEEGFISDRVMVSNSPDYSKEGEYSVVYSVTDNHGLTSEQAVTFLVDSRNRYTYVTYPDELIDKMFDEDMFNYELLKEPDIDVVSALMYPCQVAFLVKDSFKGSGFIYKIDRDYIYIGTMGHCISSKMKNQGVDLWVYNPTYSSNMDHKSTKVCLENVKAVETIRNYSSSEDNGMFKIRRTDIPNEILIWLKEVNKTNENNISLENGIYTDTIYVAKDMYTGRYKKSFTVYHHTGNSETYNTLYDYFPQYKDRSRWLQTNETGVGGQSGSLLYDGYGNPIASLSGSTVWSNASIGRHRLFDCYDDLYEQLSKEESP